MRQSERVLVKVPIEVRGAGEKPFREKTFTQIISRYGAQIGLKHPLHSDDRITVTNLRNNVSCPFRVVARIGKPLGEKPEWGVECLEPDVDLWGISFPENDQRQAVQDWVDALMECSRCRFRGLVRLTGEEYRLLVTRLSLSRHCGMCKEMTDWQFGFVEAEAEAVPTRRGSPENRRAKRVTVNFPGRIRLQDGREETIHVEDLSTFGVRLISTLRMKEAQRLRITIGRATDGNLKEVEGRVVWRKPLEGTERAIYGLELKESD